MSLRTIKDPSAFAGVAPGTAGPGLLGEGGGCVWPCEAVTHLGLEGSGGYSSFKHSGKADSMRKAQMGREQREMMNTVVYGVRLWCLLVFCLLDSSHTFQKNLMYASFFLHFRMKTTEARRD